MKLDFDTDGGIGTRANLGVIVLETDETLEHEFPRLVVRPGVALYHTRIAMVPEIRPETLIHMEAALPASARLLPPALHFDAIGFGCTSASTVIGSDRVALAVQRACPGARVTDPLAATIAACRALGVRRLGFVTPYVAEVSSLMRLKLELAGIEIAGFGSFEEGNDRVVARITGASILRAVEAVAAQTPCDAVFVACTNLRCLDVLAEAEARIGRPVISSNLALAWHMLHLAGIDARCDRSLIRPR
ncbi:MAG: aspartate/glutamate racemase family protein [Marinovum algicola]|jgi:maleate isomerase|uniref:Maleate isomerase n=1 Tax=Marinovum algicola TaxID=42444 RepID=A0A975ZLU9_9RHOB|nr:MULTISPECIES: aspartate/glutamate racemase family protein [Marinovum]MDD9741015.1 aspartate/glutamate racemase family protein [Marinovum sp. SP66]MDD9742762.1 aspartate/glutamate racemase family protein [Marinovum sp. PR37]SEI60784.1 maleate isomerase [Marinovum algicola]SLN26306.1 Maleate isomerase [Marinovum algicola]